MQLPSAFTTTLCHTLRNWLPEFFLARTEVFAKPLLDATEIAELRLRIQGQKRLAANRYDTAQQRMGDSRSTHRGYGLDYEESRPYQPGDEPRYMNWQLTARTGELYMKVFREERRPGVFIVVDRRHSMRFGTHTRLKASQAARAASCIAFGAQFDHAAVGGVILNTAAQGDLWLKEASGEQAAFDLARAAGAPCPPTTTQANLRQDGESDFAHMLNLLQALLVPGTQVYLISDFIDLDERHRATLMQLAAQHQVQAIHIVDPAEQLLPRVGMVHIQPSARDTALNVDTDNTDITQAYANAAAEHFAARQQLFHALRIAYTRISTESDAIESELAAP